MIALFLSEWKAGVADDEGEDKNSRSFGNQNGGIQCSLYTPKFREVMSMFFHAGSVAPNVMPACTLQNYTFLFVVLHWCGSLFFPLSVITNQICKALSNEEAGFSS